MARKKISEFRAKTLLYEALGQPYAGVSLDTAGDLTAALAALPADQKLVVKVDEGIKGRFKKGLVTLNRSADELPDDVSALQKKGYRFALAEPYQPHEPADEHYLALERRRGGNVVTFSAQGGVDVEAHADSLKTVALSAGGAGQAETALKLPAGTVAKLAEAFDANYFSFLEINPLVVTGGHPLLLDAAVEVDGEAAVFVGERWTPADYRSHTTRAKLPQEVAVDDLASRSQASFRLEVLNPDGAVFLLLSGGGASVVLADEVSNQGFGDVLGNYGEYSGNPNAEETYLYTREVISLMLASKAPHKVLVISGGVANFTDVRATFKGVIRALTEAKAELLKQGIKVFVRRGGPFETEGLALMKTFLEKEGLLGVVAGPSELPLSGIIPAALKTLGTKAQTS